MQAVTDWLLTGPVWVRYRTLVDLLDKQENSPEVLAARQTMLSDKAVQDLLSELAEWPGTPLTRHNDAGHLLHKLVFIADTGIKVSDPGVQQITQCILQHQSPEGAFQVTANVNPRYGGTGQDTLSWMLCDTPSVLYALVKLGLKEEDAVQKAIRHLSGLIIESGWPCAVSPEMGKFRGPGRKTDPCPYATLISLKALAQIPEWRECQASRTGAETLLQLWEQRKERRPYLFAMGTDFTKLKAPLIWYDILHVLEVLTQFSWLYEDQRLLEMLDILKTRADVLGRFPAGSVWKAWSEWEFGQKKAPSFGITFLVLRILKRMHIML